MQRRPIFSVVSSCRFTMSLLALAAVLAGDQALGEAGRVRVDVGADDGRRDTGTPYWQTWKVKQGGEASRTFADVTVTLRPVEQANGRIDTFLTKAGIDTGATMATDGVSSTSGIEIEIEGLSAGPHTVVTYHNSIWDELVSRQIVSCSGARVSPESISSLGLEASRQVSHDDDVASSLVSFVATAGEPVVIRIVPGEGGMRRLALLNGFEIDSSDPRHRARKPVPPHDDEHVDGDTGSVQLQWMPAVGAVRYEVYVESDRDPEVCAARVAQAGRDDSALLTSTSVPRATLDIADNDSLLHYCWRVDAVDQQGQATRADVWRFRVRHLAFPGAEGYGRHARGGRGGRVIEVTNLNDSGSGSLRAAVEAEGPRTVVFNVSGLITLKSKLVLTRANSNITVAGQTAPGKGICIRNWTFGTVGARDVIIRYVRLRLGDLANTTMDGMGLAAADHAIIDHCSISWTIDEAFSSRGAGNVTLQRCLIAEALNEANHEKYGRGARHGFAASIGGDIGSFHHNLLAHCAGRNWSMAGGLNQAGRHTGRLDIRNNVVYNWHNRTTDGGARQVNFVNNYYKPGPASTLKTYLNPQFENPAFGPQQYYVEGNIMEGIAGPEGPIGPFQGMNVRGRQEAPTTVSTPFFEHHVTTHTAEQAYQNVLADVGCQVPMLDEHDQRVIQEVRSGTTTYKGSKTELPGIPDTQTDVGGWDEYPEVHRPVNWDTDHDGLPDTWEIQHKLDPDDAQDANGDSDGDGFTNLEDYLNWLAAGSNVNHQEVNSVDHVDGNLILFNDNGAWSWYQDERAIVDQNAGKLLISSVAASPRFDDNSRDGNVDLVTLDLATGERTRFVLGQIQRDDHNLAALLKRPDGRYLAVYANHNSDRVSRYRVSVKPQETRQWTPERHFNWRETPGNDFNVTYSNLFYLEAENKVYNFARVNDRSPNMMLSTDQGDTWTYGGQLTRSENVGYVNGYFKYASNGKDRIHLIATEAHPRDYNNGIYHAYIQGGKLFGSDGSLIDGDIHDNEDIPSTTSLTPVFVPDQEDGAQQRHRAWTTDLSLDKSGLPHALFTTRAGDARPSRDGSGDDRRLYYARYDGQRWAYHEVAKMGRRLFRSEQDYTGLGALVPGDPSTIYISTTIHPGTQEETSVHEIYRGVTNGDGREWQWTPVTQQSSVDNLRPIIPQWSGDNLAVLWFRGRMQTSQRYDCAIVGVIHRAGETVGKIRYVDADKDNTMLADERSAQTTGAGLEADIEGWRFLADVGGNESVFEAGESEGVDAPMLKTQLTDLGSGTYDLFAFFRGSDEGDWQLKAGFSPDKLLSFRRMACQAANVDQFLPNQTVAVTSASSSLYRGYVGRVRVKDGDTVTVYIDDDSSVRQRRTQYDGIGWARVDE